MRGSATISARVPSTTISPKCMTVMRSAKSSATSMSCSIITMVTSRSMPRRSFSTSRRSSIERPANGSSSSSTLGAWASAMALAQAPKVLLLDEPFAGLSIDERRDVLKLLLGIERDVTIVMIEHDMDVALDFAERITVMHFGEIVVEGTRAEIVADPRIKEIYFGE